MINGNTQIIAHVGYPTHTFKSPMIYNPYFEHAGINAVVVPMAVTTEDYPQVIRSVFKMKNVRGALITMPHKVTTVELAQVLTPTAQIAGACNALRLNEDGKLIGDMFDGAGFVRGLSRKGFTTKGATCLVVGSGGVGSAIAASLAAAGVKSIALFDTRAFAAKALGDRIKAHYPDIEITTNHNDPTGMDLLVNATPLGMNEGDPLPVGMSCVASSTFVGEVVMKSETTAFLKAAIDRGCKVQIGTDMLFEQIPAYLEFFDFPTTTAEHLRSVTKLQY